MTDPAATAPAATGGADGRPTTLIADGPDAPARVAADLLVAWLAAALGTRGEAHLALTGGSSAKALYAALRDPARSGAVDWARVHAWVGDDRFVALDHADSNSGLARRELLDGAAGPLAGMRHHPVPTEAALAAAQGPDAAAAAYLAEVMGAVPLVEGVPAFDVVLLGVGSDGHLLSVFPGSAALAPGAPLAMGIPAPTHITPHLPRVTLSPAILGVAGHVMPIVTGTGKAAIVAHLFGAEVDPVRWPAQLALRPNATWVLDAASAADLPRG